MNASPTHCAGCDRAFRAADGRYLSQLRPGGALIALCDSCGERYAELVVRDPDGAELGAFSERVLLAAAEPQGTA